MVCNHFHPCIGGIERMVLDEARALKGRGHSVRVVCLDRCANSRETLPAAEKVEGIDVKRIPFIDLRFYKFAPAIALNLKDAEVVHVHGVGFFSDFLLFFKWLHRKKLVVSTHGGIFHTKRLYWVKKIYFRVFQRLLLSAAERVAADSENDSRLFSAIVPLEKLVRLRNAVNLKWFKGNAPAKKKNSLLFVGRLSRNKRVDLLLKAFSVAAREVEGAELRIVGEDFEGLEKGLREMAAELKLGKRVRFLGRVSDQEVLRELERASFYVSASEFEGFGISAVEAMAAGAIPILNNIEAFREIVEEGKNGFIVDFAEKEKAGKQIARILEMPPEEVERVRKNALKRAGDFGLEAHTEQLERVYLGAVK